MTSTFPMNQPCLLQSLLRGVAFSSAAVLLATKVAYAQFEILIESGDEIPGLGQVTDISEFVTNRSGDWAATVLVGQSATPVLLYNGAVFAKQGDPFLGSSHPIPTQGEKFLDLDDAGNIAWVADDLTDPQAKQTIYVNYVPYLIEGQSTGFAVYDPDDIYSQAKALRLDPYGSGRLYVSTGLNGYNFSSVLVSIERLADGTLSSELILAPDQQVLPEVFVLGDITEFPKSRTQFALGANGDLMLVSGFDKSAVLFRDGQSKLWSIEALSGEPSALFGSKWAVDQSEVALNSVGDRAYTIGTTSGQKLLMLNGGIVAFEDGSLPAIAPFQLTDLGGESIGMSGYRSQPICLSETGRLLWLGEWNDPDLSRNSGLFVDQDLILQAGVAKIAGVTIESFHRKAGSAATESATYHIDASGKTIAFRARLVDGTRGAYRFTYQSDYKQIAGCTPKLAHLHTQSWNLGETAQSALLYPQSDFLGAALLVSTAGSDGACGTFLPGLGELLVDLSPAALVWADFQPVDFVDVVTPFQQLQVPNNHALVGTTLFLQGAWLDFTSSVEPVRFSNAVQLVIYE